MPSQMEEVSSINVFECGTIQSVDSPVSSQCYCTLAFNYVLYKIATWTFMYLPEIRFSVYRVCWATMKDLYRQSFLLQNA